MSQIAERRIYTESRTRDLRLALDKAEVILGDKACVYATGSFGRLEASEKSDLDLFIVGYSKDDDDGQGIKKSKLSILDEILVKAELISAIRQLKIPDFDGDGKYLGHYSVDEFTKTLGKPDDDARNTLTGRLLLFLESRPLLGEEVYNQIIGEVIAAYWGDYQAHKENFLPAFLVNDILRLWRTLCVNYEANTRNALDYDKKLKRKVKNYKLKHSRMLTCYSALIYLLGIYRLHDTVSIENAKNMTRLTPIERLDWIAEESFFETAKGIIKNLRSQYEIFLENTSQGDDSLKEFFADRHKGEQLMQESYLFGDLIFETMMSVGEGSEKKHSKLLRLMVV